MSFKFISKIRKQGPKKKVIYVPKENHEEVELNKLVLVKEISLEEVDKIKND